MTSLDTLKTRRTLTVNGIDYDYFSLPAAEQAGLSGLTRLPCSLKILLENLLRHEDGQSVTLEDIKALTTWLKDKKSDREIAYRPARVLMQDFTGVPAVLILPPCVMLLKKWAADPERINPLSPVDLVIDHSVQVDAFGTKDALEINAQIGNGT